MTELTYPLIPQPSYLAEVTGPDYNLVMTEDEFRIERRRALNPSGYRTSLTWLYRGVAEYGLAQMVKFWHSTLGCYQTFTLPDEIWDSRFLSTPDAISQSVLALADSQVWRFAEPFRMATPIVAGLYEFEVKLVSMRPTDWLEYPPSPFPGY